MHATHFDRRVQAFAASGSRRGLLRLLAILPVPGALAAFPTLERASATRRRGTPHDHGAAGRNPLQEQGKKKTKKCAQAGQTPSKKRKRCCAGLGKDATGRCVAPASGCTPATCAPNACGSVPDGCGGPLSCGGCAGNTLCLGSVCQACDVCTVGCLFSTIAQAVAAASSGDTIRLCPGLYAGNLTVDKDLTLVGAGDGNGAGSTILQGTGTTSVVTITFSRTVSLQHLRITGGKVGSGGGIHTNGALTLTDCTVARNTASGGVGASFGGGIFNGGSGTLTLNGCTIAANKAVGDGGGIANFGTVTLTGSTVRGNTATSAGGGIMSTNSFATVTLDTASRVTGNTANLANADSGGGILNAGSTVTLSSADNVTGNTPDNCGGTAVPLCNG